jgi:hypothetical protein
MRGAVAIACGLAALVAATACARADAIDGSWCSKEGQSLTIDGPKIRTPFGSEVQGRYSRHAFAYEAPAADGDAGQIVVMQLMDEEDMRLARLKDGVTGPVEDWRRCNVTS